MAVGMVERRPVEESFDDCTIQLFDRSCPSCDTPNNGELCVRCIMDLEDVEDDIVNGFDEPGEVVREFCIDNFGRLL